MSSTTSIGPRQRGGNSAAIRLLRLARRFAAADGRQEARDERRADRWAIWRERLQVRRQLLLAGRR